ncbi:hypothetical protein Tco_0493186 [Tanacetum coccineum]
MCSDCPRSQWLTIGKSNLLFNAQKIQKNPIFQISVDILSNTNFFQAFTASANVPAIYLQQFWKTMSYNEKTGVYSCQVDEQWFELSADLLRKALAITPVNPTHPFELPPSGDTVIDFVNELGYPEPVEIVSSIRVNYVYQPWRAILSLLNQCLTGKTSGSDKPRHPVLQMLWGIVTQTNVDHAELIWGRVYSRDPDIFLTQSKPQSQSEEPKEESNSSPHSLWTVFQGNLKFVPKGESVEVFGMAIPDPLITEAIQQSSYYPKYLEMVAKNTKKILKESAKHANLQQRVLHPKSPHTPNQSNKSKPALLRQETFQVWKLLMKREKEKVMDADLERSLSSFAWSAFLPQGRATEQKLDDGFLKVLERHTADLIKKYSVFPGLESVKNQESEKSPKEIIKAKKEQGEDEDVWIRKLNDKVKDHKRKHDSDDDKYDDDDEGPSAGSNQGRSTKKRRSDSAASGSAKPPPKDDDQRCKGMTLDMEDRTTLNYSQGVDIRGLNGDSEARDLLQLNRMGSIPPMIFPLMICGSFINGSGTRTGKKKLAKADFSSLAFNLVKSLFKEQRVLQYQMDECHKLLTNLEPQFIFNKDLALFADTVTKREKIALSISKLKAARYLDFGLEELVPSLWVESEREYDISAVYGITHCVKVFEKYGYNYLREIILRRADYQEYKISEKDFKNLHPNDFEDLFLLNIQEKLNHLPKTDKIVFTQNVHMWIRNWCFWKWCGRLTARI